MTHPMRPRIHRRSILAGVLSASFVVGCRKEAIVNPQASVTTVEIPLTQEFVVLGDSTQLTARVIDGNGVQVQNATIDWSSSNPSIASISASGVVVGRAAGEATITAKNGTASASTLFTVDPPPCAAQAAFAVGEVRRYRGAAAFGCLTLPAITPTQNFLYIVGNARPVPDDTLNYTLTLGPTTLAEVSPKPSFDLGDYLATQSMSVGAEIETRLRSYERKMVSEALENTQRRSGLAATAAQYSVQTAALMGVGDTVTVRVPNLNTGKNICKDFISIRAVVKTVSRRATLMEDIASPTGRLTTADYDAIAQEFDDKIYAADTAWFGSPTDLNNDQRISIVYTPEVNKLTPAGSGGIVGGFFFGSDLIRRNEFPTTNDCRNQTNEQEIFYLLAPDPTGSINGNARTTAGVRQVTRGTIAHEFQHMINQSVRQYNPEVKAFEVPWLNEALSHFAEEAVGRAVNGFSDFQSLRTTDVNPSTTNQNDFLAFYRQNLTRFRLWMLRPDTASPTSVRARTELAARGADWALVRYAADHYSNGNARAFFRKLAAGPEVDITNFTLRTGRSFDELLGGWLVANFVDGLGVGGIATKYTYTSWDLRDVMSGVNNNTFPLSVTTFPGTFTSQAFSGSGNYYTHLRASPGAVPLQLRTNTGAAMTSPNARVWVVRLN